MHSAVESYSFTYNLCDCSVKGRLGDSVFHVGNKLSATCRGLSEIICVQPLSPSTGIQLYSQGDIAENIPDCHM